MKYCQKVDVTPVSTTSPECDFKSSATNVICTGPESRLLSTFTSQDRRVLEIRSKVSVSLGTRICYAHEKYLFVTFPNNQKSCCDPTRKHKRVITSNLRQVSLDQYFRILERGFATIPGQKICTNCLKYLEKLSSKFELEICSQETNSQESLHLTPDDSTPTCTPQENAAEFCNNVFEKCGISPIKLDGRTLARDTAYAQKKMTRLRETCETKIKKALQLPSTLTLGIPADISEQSDLFDDLINDVKHQMRASSRTEKIQLLTIMPDTMKQAAIMNYFNVSDRVVRKARQLKHERGILGRPECKTGRTLDNTVVQHVLDFYCDDVGAHSRIMPGMKDRVKIAKDSYVQKRLMLLNLRELYAEFKINFPSDKVGFSKFCELRPKQCILPGANGTHCICVCLIHQNFKLLVSSCSKKLTANEVIGGLVCNPENKNCMFGLCTECPKDDDLPSIIQKLLFPNGDPQDIDEDEEHEYKEWCSTDRCELVTKKCTKSYLIPLVQDSLRPLLRHSFIAKAQSKYLKMKKETLVDREALVLLDFSENYKYVVQDDIQQRYWHQTAVTIHPIVVYVKENGAVANKNFCYFTDDLKHDVVVVKLFIDKILEHLKNKLPGIKADEFFSDGCGGQYKNSEVFAYLTSCQEKFGFQLKWNFFATSHGKSACDGIGGMIKRQAAIASLKRPYNNQIVSLDELLKFCRENIKSVLCEAVTGKEITILRETHKRTAATIPGTRSFHQFFIHRGRKIRCKHTSLDETPALAFDLSGKVIKSWSCQQYVAFSFNDMWHLGIIVDSDDLNLEAEISVLFPNKSKQSYSFPDPVICLSIPFAQILCDVKLNKTKKVRNLFKLNRTDRIRKYFAKFKSDMI